jgi:ubiquinone/menaquinone biosynthesis C-methylase UbiE
MRRIKQENLNTPQAFDEMWQKDSEEGRKFFFDMYRFEGLAEDIPDDGRVIEFGAGCSDFLSFLLNHRTRRRNDDLGQPEMRLGLEAHAIDYSRWAMEYMHRLDPRIQHKVGDFLASGYPSGWFDAVLAGETIEHMEDPQLLVNEMARVTKPGGIYRVTTLLPHLQETSEYHLWEFEPEDLRVIFERAWLGAVVSIKTVGNYFVVTGRVLPE